MSGGPDMKKVMLIAPPMTFLPFEKPRVVAPLGVSYIAAFLEKNGQRVKILDAVASGWRTKQTVHRGGQPFVRVGLAPSEIREEVSAWKPDVVGISCLFSSQAHNAHEVARLVKSVDKDITTVFGGAHPSVLPQKTLQDPNVDFVVIGEGELTMLELVNSLGDTNRYPKILGLAFKRKGEFSLNPPRPFIEDIDTLPFPARHLLPMEEYFRAAAGHGAAERKSRFTSMITSRGCPRNCIFCSIHTVWGHRWRPRSPERVLEEIELLVKDYGVEEIHFEDDNLTLNPKRMEAICDGIMERGLDISWATPNGVDINTLDRDLLKKMKLSGCYWLCFGLEHGDPYFRSKVIGKTISGEHAKNVVRWANELGMWTNGFFIIGLPGETPETVGKTLRFAKELDLDFASFFIATPYPGTRLYELATSEGYIVGEPDWSGYKVLSPTMDIRTMSKAEVASWLKRANREFYKFRLLREFSLRSIRKRLKQVRSRDDARLILRLVKYFVSDVMRRGG
jgi:magnesium-protoporphyrin IX monomethyl ester (oxidative) cyclase